MSQPPAPDTVVVRDMPLGRGLIVMVLLWIVVAVQAALIAYFLITDPARQALPLPLFGAFLLLALVVTIWWIRRRRWVDAVAAHGETTRGRVERLGSSYDRGGDLSYVRYSYEVKGKAYRGKYYYDPQAVSFQEGQAVRVRYDRDKPQRAILVYP
ncbi:MAG: DUF3592 domain-containing protein [SAR324 cluster bacterium]|nr:DUF3592 domain-containing protein [SAR324 cluster bacterium]